MTNDEIRAAIQWMNQRWRGELSAIRCIILQDLIGEAELLLSGVNTERPRAEIEADIQFELTREAREDAIWREFGIK